VNVPSPLNPLGVKGLGEGGAIGPPAAIANAVEDALADLGAVVRTCPLSPSRIRELIRSAKVNTVDSAQ
jgi:carbon-monoxide dehydrogenase large subunit